MRKIYFLFVMLLVFAGCEKDEAVVNPHEDRDQSVATVSQKEVFDYLNASKSSSLQNKDSGLDLTLDLSLSEHEPLTNTDQKLLVVPAQTRYHAENTRAVFLKIEGTIEPLLIYMFADKNVEGAYFSGRIVISELDGEFKRGFRIKNGVFTHSLVLASGNYQQRGSDTGCAEHQEDNPECYFCTQQLEAVVIQVSSDPSPDFNLRLYPAWGGGTGNGSGTDLGMSWDYGSGGGGGWDEEVSIDPLFQYPEGSNYAEQYPKLTEYLKNQLPTIKDNPVIISAIQTYTSLTTTEIVEDLTWGEGPIIKVEQLDDFCVTCSSNTYGFFDSKNHPDKLFIDVDLVNDLENTVQGSGLADSFSFLVGVTILHEYVHFGDNDGGDFPGEEGELFEADIYGQTVWRSNAGTILLNNP